MTDFIFLDSKITVDSECSHKIKRCLSLGRKAIINIDRIFKSRDITLLTKVYLVKGMVFPIDTYGCENWTIKKAECWRIDAFELWYWRRLLRVPWTARKWNQSILKEINSELEGLMLKWNSNNLATWYEDPTHWKRPWFWERLKFKRWRSWQRMRWFSSIPYSMDMNRSKLQEIVKDRGACVLWSVGVSKSWAQVSD